MVSENCGEGRARKHHSINTGLVFIYSESTMSKDAVQKVINKAISDIAFRKKLLTNPDEALKDYQDKLTSEELAALKSMKPELLNGFSSLMEQKTKKQPSMQPSSFKELFGAFLSLVLLVLLFFAANNAYKLVSTEPVIYTVGNNTQSIDIFDRSKDLLVIFFPMFTSVVTFWLGVEVEGRRADTSQANAETERQERVIAEQNMRDVSINASSTISKVEGILSGASVTTLQKGDKDNLIKDALTILRAGRESIRH